MGIPIKKVIGIVYWISLFLPNIITSGYKTFFTAPIYMILKVTLNDNSIFYNEGMLSLYYIPFYLLFITNFIDNAQIDKNYHIKRLALIGIQLIFLLLLGLFLYAVPINSIGLMIDLLFSSIFIFYGLFVILLTESLYFYQNSKMNYESPTDPEIIEI